MVELTCVLGLNSLSGLFLEMCVFSYETLIHIALNLITNEYTVDARNSRQENSGKLHISGHFSNDQLSTKGLLNSHNCEKPRKSGMNLGDQTFRYCEKLKNGPRLLHLNNFKNGTKWTYNYIELLAESYSALHF